MQLSLKGFSSLVETMSAAVQGAAAQLLDLSVGSVLRAVLEANAAIALWMQWLILQTLQATRLATSTGADVDSFGADFGMTRLAATTAGGSASFARFTPTIPAIIPVGTTIATSDATARFIVTVDATNAAWSAAQNGYLLGAGVSSVTVPIAALVAGSAGNVLPGMISLIATALPGIDSVTNVLALSGGLDAESDIAFRARFQLFIDSRSRATLQAVSYAATSVQQNITCAVIENSDAAGDFEPGHFVVYVDDGTGAPPSSLLTAVQQAVDAVRPVGSVFAVFGPTVLDADLGMTLVLATGADSATVIAQVSGGLTGFINTLPVGAGLAYTRLAQLVYDANPAVTNVTSLLLNGATADLPAAPGTVIKLGALAID
jgi:phage-related baseplate assembly protein